MTEATEHTHPLSRKEMILNRSAEGNYLTEI